MLRNSHLHVPDRCKTPRFYLYNHNNWAVASAISLARVEEIYRDLTRLAELFEHERELLSWIDSIIEVGPMGRIAHPLPGQEPTP